jgi:hypothetical protein
MSYRLTLATFVAIACTFVMFAGSAIAVDSDVYGPINLLKTMATPFGSPLGTSEPEDTLAPLTLHSSLSKNLASRLVPPRLYLPGRMVIGQTEEFIIKGKAGQWAALAMADKNKGAKPIYGHSLHLGPDRKLVSLGQIPEGGVLSLVIDTPVQGDLIGSQLYFEAVLWSKPDFSDVEVAAPVPSETAGPATDYMNGIVVAGEVSKKKGIRIVPEGMVPMQMTRTQGMDSGRP